VLARRHDTGELRPVHDVLVTDAGEIHVSLMAPIGAPVETTRLPDFLASWGPAFASPPMSRNDGDLLFLTDALGNVYRAHLVENTQFSTSATERRQLRNQPTAMVAGESLPQGREARTGAWRRGRQAATLRPADRDEGENMLQGEQRTLIGTAMDVARTVGRSEDEIAAAIFTLAGVDQEQGDMRQAEAPNPSRFERLAESASSTGASYQAPVDGVDHQ
jgi:hypothetical protein